MLAAGRDAHEQEARKGDKRKDIGSVRIATAAAQVSPKPAPTIKTTITRLYSMLFDVVACLHCLIPEVENLRDLRAKTNQEKQKRSELKKVSPHFTFDAIYRFGVYENARAPPQHTAVPCLKKI